MALRRFVFLLLVFALLIDDCYGQKKGKKNKGKKEKSGKNKKVQKVVGTLINGPENIGSPLVRFDKKAPYRTKRDEEYWTAGGTQRSYRIEDSPHFNLDFLNLYDDIREAVMPPGTTPEDITHRDFAMTEEQIEAHFFAHLSMVQDLHVMKHYIVSQGEVKTVFAVHLDTKNGTDMPPIFGDNPLCTLEWCMHPDYQVPFFSESEYFLPLPESGLQRLTEEMLEKLELMLDVYPIGEVRKMVCQQDTKTGDSSWLTAQLEVMGPKVEEILENPAASSVLQVEKDLDLVHDFIRGNLISVLLLDLCESRA